MRLPDLFDCVCEIGVQTTDDICVHFLQLHVHLADQDVAVMIPRPIFKQNGLAIHIVGVTLYI